MTDSDSRSLDPCAACAGRRAFLRDAVSGLGALAGLAMLTPASELHALAPRRGGPVRYPVPAGDGASIDKEHAVILARVGPRVFAFALACPHQGAALRALPEAEGFRCPRHQSRYQPDGTFISGRATRSMDRLQITRDGEALVVDPGVIFASDKDAERWAAAVVTL